MKHRQTQKVIFHILRLSTAVVLAFLLAFSPLFPVISPTSPITQEIKDVAYLIKQTADQIQLADFSPHSRSYPGGALAVWGSAREAVVDTIGEYTNRGRLIAPASPTALADELDEILSEIETPNASGGQLLVKVSPAESDEDFKPGDIVHAFNRKRSLTVGAQVITNPRNFGFNQHGLREPDTLLDIYLAHAKEYKFERIGEFEVKKTDLATGKETIISNKANQDGEQMDVSLYLERRLSSGTHLVFGLPGSEYWYGGSENLSDDNLDTVWSVIESRTDYHRNQYIDYPSGDINESDYRVIPVADFSDEVAGELSANEEGADNTRKYQVDIDSLREEIGESEVDLQTIITTEKNEDEPKATPTPEPLISRLKQRLFGAPSSRAAGTVTTSIGSNDRNVSITAVSGSGPYTVTLADASTSKVGDALWDEHATPRKYLITAISSNDLTVRDTEAVGAAPDNSGTSTAGVKRYYSTITLWEADLDDTGIYTSGDDAVGEAYNDAAFDESVTINGGATVGLASITLTVSEGDRHDGTAGTGARIVKTGLGNIITVSDITPATTIEWLELDANGQAIETAISDSNSSYVQNNIVHDNGGSSTSPYAITAAGYIHNNIVYDWTTARASFVVAGGINSSGNSSILRIENNTVYNIGLSADTSNSTAFGIGARGYSGEIVRNNISVGAYANTATPTDFRDNGGGPNQSYNLSSDATASGTGSLTSKTAANQFISITGGSEDLHLKSGADAINAGTDLATTPTGVNIDIDGRDRDAEGDTWDIGAHEHIGDNYAWDAGGDGVSWNDPDNWNIGTGYPDDATDIVTINTGSAAITMPNGGTTIGALTLGSSYTGTLTLEDSLTIDDAGGRSGNLTIQNGATLQTDKDEVSNITVDGTLLVESGGELIVRRSSTTSEGAGQTITAGTVTVDSGGSINANGEGFNAGQGPGETVGPNNYGGACHGGGVGDSETHSCSTYGSMTNPTALGSGGGATASIGGGAIILSSAGTVTINGTLSSNADSANGGASGGSVNITAATLAGAGVITANGGDGSGSYGGGAGGRVSLNGVTTDTFTGTLQVNGGSGGRDGYAGTLYLNAAKRSSWTIANTQTYRLGSDGTNNYTFGAITIESGGTLEIDSHPNMNSNNGGAATLNVTTLDVQSGGILSADGLGFDSQMGPGSTDFSSDGGTYGGEGGTVSGTSSPTYGSLVNPINPGSSARLASADGGGAIIVSASGSVTINGTVSANSSSANYTGSGGSVNITADTISGSGTVQTNAATPGSSWAGGGGGRIAVSLTTGTSFGTITFQSFGALGNGTSRSGAAGTIYLEDSSDGSGNGQLIIDNNSNTTAAGTDTLISSSVTDTAVGDVLIQNAGKLQMDASTSLTVSGNWTNSGTADLADGTVIFDATDTGNTITPGGDYFDNVTFNGVGGAWDLQGAADINDALTITNGTFDLNGQNIDLTGGTFSNSGTLRLQGSETLTAFTNDTNSGTVVYDGTGTYASGLVGGDGYYLLEFNGSGGSWTLDAALDVNSNLTLTAGTLIDAGNTITLGGNWSNAATYTGTGAVTFDASSGTQTLTSGGTGTGNDFQNITKSGGGTLQFITNPVDIDGTLTIDVSTIVDANGQNVTAGTLVNNGTFLMEGGETVAVTTKDTDSGLVKYDGTGSYTTALAYGNTYYDLEFAGSGGVWEPDGAVTTNNNLTLTSGTFDIDGQALTVTGTLANNATLRLLGTETLSLTNDTNSGTISYDNTATLADFPANLDDTYYNITFAGTGTVQLAAALVAAGSLTISSGATLDMNGFDITVAGNLTNAGTLTGAGTRTITLNGTSQTFTPANISLATLALTGSAGTVSVGSNFTITTLLSIIANRGFSLGNFIVTLPGDLTNAGTITEGGSGYIAKSASNFYIATSDFNEDPAISLGVDKIYLSIMDVDGNKDGTAPDTIGSSVSVTCPNGGTADSETVTLTETGNATGVFRYTAGITTATYDGSITENDGTLECIDSDTITATYTDPQDGDDTEQDTATATTDVVPTAPSSLSGSADSTAAITWSWTDNASDETGFKLYNASNNALVATIATASLSTGLTVTHQETGLSAGTTYSRYVVAYNAAGNSTASATAQATTDPAATPTPTPTPTPDADAEAPTVPMLVSPANGATLTTVFPTFTFNRSTDDDGIATYRLLINPSTGGEVISFSDLAAGASVVASQATITGTNATISVTITDPELFENGNVYSWKVRAIDGGGTSTDSDIRSFEIDTTVTADSTTPQTPTQLQVGVTPGTASDDPLTDLAARPPSIADVIRQIEQGETPTRAPEGVQLSELSKQARLRLEKQSENLFTFLYSLFPAHWILQLDAALALLVDQARLAIAYLWDTTTDALASLFGTTRQYLATLLELINQGSARLALEQQAARDLVGQQLSNVSQEQAVAVSNALLALREQATTTRSTATSQLLRTNELVEEQKQLTQAAADQIRSAIPSITDEQLARLLVFTTQTQDEIDDSLHSRRETIIAGLQGWQGYIARAVVGVQTIGQRLQAVLIAARNNRLELARQSEVSLDTVVAPIRVAFGRISLGVRLATDALLGSFDSQLAITDVTVEELESTRIVISWRTSRLTTGKVNWGRTLAYGADGQGGEVHSDELSNTHQIEIAGVEPNTRIYFEVVSTDAQSVSTADAYYSITTPSNDNE